MFIGKKRFEAPPSWRIYLARIICATDKPKDENQPPTLRTRDHHPRCVIRSTLPIPTLAHITSRPQTHIRPIPRKKTLPRPPFKPSQGPRSPLRIRQRAPLRRDPIPHGPVVPGTHVQPPLADLVPYLCTSPTRLSMAAWFEGRRPFQKRQACTLSCCR